MNPFRLIRWIQTLLTRPLTPLEFLNDTQSEGNYWVILSRILGVETPFKREFRRVAQETLIREYSRQGVDIKITTYRGRHSVDIKPNPGFFTRRVVDRLAGEQLHRFSASRLSELTGRSPEELERQHIFLYRMTYVGRRMGFLTLKVAVRMTMLSDTYSGRKYALNPALANLVFVGNECEGCDLDVVTHHERWLRVSRTLGVKLDGFIHLLTCHDERLRQARQMVRDQNFREYTALPNTDRVSGGASLAVNVSYSLETFEDLARRMEAKELDRTFLIRSVEYGLLALPQDLATLKNLVGRVGWESAAAYYHRGVPTGHLLTVHELVTSDLLTFYEARRAAEAGVLPEIVDILGHLKSPGVTEVIKVHQLVEHLGPEPVKESVLRDPSRALTFWSTHPQATAETWPDLWTEWENEKIRNGVKPSLIPTAPQIHPTSKRKARAAQTVVQEVPGQVQTQDSSPGKAWYQTVSVSEFPIIRGKEWQRLLESCGWRITHQKGSSHKRMGKGRWEITYVDYGSRQANRYVVFDWFRRGNVPEEEVRQIITTWQGRRRK